MDRKQYVNTNESISSLKPISMGVPQGSILGLLLYIIYVNDLSYALNCRLLQDYMLMTLVY